MKVSIVLITLLLCMSCGPAPIPGPKGDTGAPGIQGVTGPTGNPGESGKDGEDGAPGKDATPVTVVPLCPGTTAYPTRFVEIAFCIDGKLYAVYSTNNGFETQLVPGAYYSNAIGSTCNFSVGANCEVTPL